MKNYKNSGPKLISTKISLAVIYVISTIFLSIVIGVPIHFDFGYNLLSGFLFGPRDPLMFASGSSNGLIMFIGLAWVGMILLLLPIIFFCVSPNKLVLRRSCFVLLVITIIIATNFYLTFN